MPITFSNTGNSGNFSLFDEGKGGSLRLNYVSSSEAPLLSPSPTPSVSVTPTPSLTPSVSTTPSISVTPSVSSTPTPSVSTTPSISVTPSVSATPGVTDAIRSQLSTSSGSYDSASLGNWVKVTKAEYDRVAANVTGATKKGNNDTQINTRSVATSWTNQWIAFGTGSVASFQIDNGEYVIAMITEAWNQSGGTSQLAYTTTFTGSAITNIGGTAGPSTGGVRDYFVRKAPNDAATETRYPVLRMTVSPNAVLSWPGFRSADSGSTWISLFPNQISKIQIVTTSTKSW